MIGRRLLAVGLAAAAIALPRLADARAREAVIQYDHERDSLASRLDGKSVRIEDGDLVRVPPGAGVSVKVASTNTALYTFGVDVVETESEDARALRALVPILKTYVPDLAPERLGALPDATTEIGELLVAIRGSLDAVDRTEALALNALARMSAGSPVREVAERFKADVAPLLTEAGKPRLRLVATIAEQLDALGAAIQKAPRDPQVEKARKLVAGSTSVLSGVNAVERLVLAVAGAKDEWSQPTGRLGATRERSITLSVRPKAESPYYGFAAQPSRKLQVRIEPRWPFRLAAGVALIVSPESRFTTFTADGVSPPVETGSQDARITYGFSLALTPAQLRLNNGVTVWLLDLTLNPSDNVRAAGLGSAVNWGIIKLSAGALWTKHQRVNGTLVEETYGSPEAYAGLGVAGWLD